MKRTLYLFLFIAISIASVYAHDITVVNPNGKIIYYNKLTNEVEVTYRGFSWGEYTNEYTGVIVIPASVTYMNKAYTVTRIYYAAFCACSNLTAVTIPQSVTTIGADAFKSCTSLGVVNLTKGLKKIESGAFQYCSRLNYIILPEGITDIGSKSFAGCSSLTSIYCYNETPNTCVNDAFDNSTYNSSTLYVPYGSKAAYQSADGWKNFKNIEEMVPSAIHDVKTTEEGVRIIGIYDSNGNKCSDLQRGINIIKYNNGETKKVLK